MLDTMTFSQLQGWLAYYHLEPWGEERADLRMGITASTIANANRVKGKALTPGDFMPDFKAVAKTSAARVDERKPLTDTAKFNHMAAMIESTYRQRPTPADDGNIVSAPTPPLRGTIGRTLKPKPKVRARHLPPGASYDD